MSLSGTHTHAHMHARTHTHTHACMHAYTHTHTHTCGAVVPVENDQEDLPVQVLEEIESYGNILCVCVAAVIANLFLVVRFQILKVREIYSVCCCCSDRQPVLRGAVPEIESEGNIECVLLLQRSPTCSSWCCSRD